jgi:hypothetical protein
MMHAPAGGLGGVPPVIAASEANRCNAVTSRITQAKPFARQLRALNTHNAPKCCHNPNSAAVRRTTRPTLLDWSAPHRARSAPL